MRQRVVIAIALSCKPKILIADEPTTALDVTIQAQILDLIADLQEEIKAGIILITHDLETVSKYATRVLLLNGKNHKIVNDINIIKQMGKSSFDDIYRSEGLI